MSYECPRCGSEEAAVPRWNSMESYDNGGDPDSIGCLNCGVMDRVEDP